MRSNMIVMMAMTAAFSVAAAGVTDAVSPPVVALDHKALDGKGLEKVAPYRKELNLARLQQLSARELYNGDIVVDVWETQDGGTLLLKDYPFDQYVHVLHGTTTLVTKEGVSHSFSTGDSFVVPRGFKGTWTLSKGYRHVLVIEAKTLKDGIGQFE